MIKSFYYDKKTLNIVYIVKVRRLLRKVRQKVNKTIIVKNVINILIIKQIKRRT